MTKKLLSLAVITALGVSFSGCGSDDSNGVSSTDVTVERGAVYDANVTDAAGHIATKTLTSNIYTFVGTPTYPITVSGGWIDVDGDGNMTTSDVKLDINMTSYSNVVTPITTYLSDSNETIRKEKLDQLITDMNISETELFKVPSKASIESMLLSNAIYKKVKENNSNDMTTLNFTDLNTSYQDLHLTYEQSYKDQNLTIEELAHKIEETEVIANISVIHIDTDDITQYEKELEAEKLATATVTTTSSIDVSTKGFVYIYNNISTTAQDGLISVLQNNTDFVYQTNTTTTCASLGFTDPYDPYTDEDGLVVTTYSANDHTKYCVETDYSNSTDSLMKGTNNLLTGFNY